MFRFEVVDETIHHRNEVQCGAVKLIGTIMLSGLFNLVSTLSEAVSFGQAVSPIGQIIHIPIDFNELPLSLFVIGSLVQH